MHQVHPCSIPVVDRIERVPERTCAIFSSSHITHKHQHRPHTTFGGTSHLQNGISHQTVAGLTVMLIGIEHLVLAIPALLSAVFGCVISPRHRAGSVAEGSASSAIKARVMERALRVATSAQSGHPATGHDVVFPWRLPLADVHVVCSSRQRVLLAGERWLLRQHWMGRVEVRSREENAVSQCSQARYTDEGATCLHIHDMSSAFVGTAQYKQLLRPVHRQHGRFEPSASRCS
ncbi:hypothetical protein B0J18DRAFT_16727 [Chaetomium sp. MPI-SDFR-AT-0129]|nr:hypothetical protein B0J18DRAFT_16727 [Chaetomium sp. MPI-SDFR-AT-0129]